MELEDFMPRVTMVWDDNPMPTTSVVLVPSHVDVEHESFQRAFRAHGESFLRESNHGGIVLAAVSVDAQGHPSMLGDALRFTIDHIHQGGFPLPVAGAVRHVFVDGTLDPVGGPMAVKQLLDQPTPVPPGSPAPMLTAAYLPSTAYGPFSHLTPFGQVPQPPPHGPFRRADLRRSDGGNLPRKRGGGVHRRPPSGAQRADQGARASGVTASETAAAEGGADWSTHAVAAQRPL